MHPESCLSQVHSAPGVDELPVQAQPLLGALYVVFLQPQVPGQELILAAGMEVIAHLPS